MERDAETLRGRALKERCAELLTETVQPELIELYPWQGGVQLATLMLGTRLRDDPPSPEAAQLRVRWMIEHLGARVTARTLHTQGDVTRIVSRRRRGGRTFLLTTSEIAVAIAEANLALRPDLPRLLEISTRGAQWAAACAGLRDTTTTPWTTHTAALTLAWPELSSAEREVVTGLAASWEGDAEALCAAARSITS